MRVPRMFSRSMPAQLSVAILVSLGFGLFFFGMHRGQIIEKNIAEQERKAIETARRETDRKIAASVLQGELLTKSTSIPLEFLRGVHIGTVYINGTAGRFLIDTGSMVTIIDTGFAKKLNLVAINDMPLGIETVAGISKAPWAVVRSLQVGEAKFENYHVVLHNLVAGLDGVLGMDFLGRFVTAVNPKKKTLTLTPYPPSLP